MSTAAQDIGRCPAVSADILCQIVTFVYIRCRVLYRKRLSGCFGVMDNCRPVFDGTFGPSTTFFSSKTIDFPKKICYFFFSEKAVMKTCVPGKIPREEAVC